MRGGTSTGTLSGTTISGITFVGGQETVCTFNNETAILAPDLVVTKDNDAERDNDFNDTETVPGNATYPSTVTYKVTIVNSGSTASVDSFTDVRAPNVGTGGTDSTGNTTAPAGTGTYVVTQADIDNNGNPSDGDIHNVATGDSDETGPGHRRRTVPVDQSPAPRRSSQDRRDTTDGTAGHAAGDVINYSIVVTNTGNKTLNRVTVNDPLTTWTATRRARSPDRAHARRGET